MSSARALRIFREEGQSRETGEPHGQMTLREFFEAYAQPICLAKADPRTLKEYATTIGFWERSTANPPLLRINDFAIAKFRGWLEARKYRGRALDDYTVRKHLVNLQFILDRAGPRRHRDIPAARLLPEVPAVPKPKVWPEEVVDVFTLAEIAAFMDACRAATTPTKLAISPCFFWRSLWLFDYNTGLRPETLLLLRWEWLVEDEYGWWLKIPAIAMKVPRAFTCYVNPRAMAVLERLRVHKEPLIFPWNMKESWLHNRRRAILAASSIPPERHFGFKGLRKALATELGKINPLAAQLQLAHSTGRSVTADHYTHKKVIAEAMQRLPQPPWHGDLDGRQGLLFG